MNKKLMAVAVAGALAAPAAAFAADNVQISGRAQLSFANVKAEGATAGSSADIKSRNRVDDNSSRIRFTGSEDLGGGLKAMFHMEAGVNMDTGDDSRGSTGFPGSREAFVGLAGSWGSLTLGKQNVWWTNFTDQTQANYINHGLQYNTGGSGAIGGPTTRTANDIKYSSPSWNGFRFWLNYAPNSEAAAAGADTDASIVGVSAAYLSRQLLAEFHWAKNEAAGPSPRTVKNTKVGLGWRYASDPNTLISLNLMRFEDENVAPINRKLNAWQLNWSHMMGAWQWMAQVGASGDATGTDNTGTKGWLLAAKYHFSKRTGAYISYTKVDNEAGATYDYRGGGNAVGVTGASRGADPQIFAIGVQHNF